MNAGPSLVLAWLTLSAAPASGEPFRSVRLEAHCPSQPDDACFSDLTSLGDWLWTKRVPAPSAGDSVTVSVGAGDFRGWLRCRNSGHVVFRGVDRARARLVGTVDEAPFATIRVESCDALRFEHLTVVAPASRTGRGKAVHWSGAGESHWRDVNFEAGYIAWYDSNCPHGNGLPPSGLHRFENVSIRAGTLGYFSDCGRGRLSDARIVVAPTSATPIAGLGGGLRFVVAGVKASHRSELVLERCTVSVDGSAARAPRAVQSIGLVAGADGNDHPMGAGSLEMRGGSLFVRGKPGDPAFGARADRFGWAGERSARIRVVGVRVDVPAPSTGDGRVEWIDEPH